MAKFLFPIVLLAAGVHVAFARTYDSDGAAQSSVKYEGPLVYTGLPPPVIYFPSFPHLPKRSARGQTSHIQTSIHKVDRTKAPIEYVPLPYQDLPVLVYQSKEHPPIHVVNKPGDKQQQHQQQQHQQQQQQHQQKQIQENLQQQQIQEHLQQQQQIQEHLQQQQQIQHHLQQQQHQHQQIQQHLQQQQQQIQAGTSFGAERNQQNSISGSGVNNALYTGNEHLEHSVSTGSEASQDQHQQTGTSYDGNSSGASGDFSSVNGDYQQILIHFPQPLRDALARPLHQGSFYPRSPSDYFGAGAQASNYIEGARQYKDQSGLLSYQQFAASPFIPGGGSGGGGDYRQQQSEVYKDHRDFIQGAGSTGGDYKQQTESYRDQIASGYGNQEHEESYEDERYKGPGSFAQASETYGSVAPAPYIPQDYSLPHHHAASSIPIHNANGPSAVHSGIPNRFTRGRGHHNQNSDKTFKPQSEQNYGGSVRFIRGGQQSASTTTAFHHQNAVVNPLAGYYGRGAGVYGFFGGGQQSPRPEAFYLGASTSAQPVYAQPPSNVQSGSAAAAAAESFLNNIGGSSSGDRYQDNNQQSSSYKVTTSATTATPHIIYTGHPPIHVFQHPIIVKETVNVPERPSIVPGTSEPSNYVQSSLETQHNKITIGGIGNFGATKPTFDKSAFSTSSFSDYQSDGKSNSNPEGLYSHSEGGRGIEGDYSETAISFGKHGYEGDGVSHTVDISPEYEGFTLYDGNEDDYKGIGIELGGIRYSSSPSYGNRFITGNDHSSLGYVTGESLNNALKSRKRYRGFIGRLAALGNTLLVSPFRFKPQYYHQLSGQQGIRASSGSSKGTSSSSDYGDLMTSASHSESSYATSAGSSIQSTFSSSEEGASYPKAQYKVPTTTATAAPYHHKPPIIIYKGIQPPVHVYGNKNTIEKSDEASESSSAATVHHEALSDKSPSLSPHTNHPRVFSIKAGFHLPVQANHGSYSHESYAVTMPHGFSVAFDPRATRTTYSTALDFPGYDPTERAHHQSAYSKDLPRATWMPINFPHYTEAESISDIIVPMVTEEGEEQTNSDQATDQEVEEASESPQIILQEEQSDTFQVREDVEETEEEDKD